MLQTKLKTRKNGRRTRENHGNVAFDELHHLLQTHADPTKIITWNKVREIHRNLYNGGQSPDAIMYRAIKKFNNENQIAAGAYARYEKQKKRIIFIPID